MWDLLKLLADLLAATFKPRARTEAENAVLRHQLNVLRRTAPKRPKVTNLHRLIFVWLYRWFPDVLRAVTVVRPETVLRSHRGGFRHYWRWKSRANGGRPRVPADVRWLIKEMSLSNPLWGAPRSHGELLKLGIEIGQTTVAKYMAKGRRPPSQTCKAFLKNHAPGIAVVDLFVTSMIGFEMLYALIVMGHDRRKLLSFGVTAYPTSEWIASQITETFPWDEAPNFLIRDHDAVHGAPVMRRLQAMGIRDHPTAPRSPWQNAYVERLIGSAQRECLDHVIVLGDGNLRRILKAYAIYYKEVRTHLSLDKDAPVERSIQRAGRITALPVLGRLHHQCCRI